MPTELVTVNLTRENEKEEWGFILTGGGRDKDVRLFIEQVRNLQNYLIGTIQVLRNQVYGLFLAILPTLYVLIVSKNGHFLNPPTQSHDYVIFEWSLTKLIHFTISEFSFPKLLK